MATFAVAAIAKNEVRYVKEWIGFHLALGASFIRIYDNNSSDGMGALLRAIGEKAPVETLQWNSIGDDFNNTQKRAYQDAVSHFAGSVNFVAMIDIDEFLCVDHGLKFCDVLEAYSSNVGAIACQQILFGSSGAFAAADGFVISRFTRCAEMDYVGNRWFKTIARPGLVSAIETVHSVRSSGCYVFADGSPLERPSDNPRVALRGCYHPIRLHHYAIKSRDEFELKQARMLATDLPESVKRGYSHDFAVKDGNLNAIENLDLAQHAQEVTDLLTRIGCD